MEIGMIGLGRMGMNMARRLLAGEHAVSAYNRTPEKTRELAAFGAAAAGSLPDLARRLTPPRLVWIMLPAGAPVDAAIDGIADALAPGDVIVEGGNSPYQDAPPRARALAERGIAFLDAGVSGGVWGRESGYCLMLGGDKAACGRIEPVLATLAAPGGFMYCGPSGAGHFVKMVHNGIEYGMMQAYAEGFELLDASAYADGLDYGALCDLWNQGSVVRSWLLEL
ncbi:MAG: NADP-dependent phosphogluconate dehydrogenase, partial [Desulfovibrionaceae bacterium]|nr:NADP-dependent phosphogluconate dehydrogenase [Desulfovibrionaceae bacterium]